MDLIEFDLSFILSQFEQQTQRMLFSPQSDLSSFRDYYQNSTEREKLQLEKEESLALGIHNFKMSKAFHRLEWKIQRTKEYNLMFAFKKMAAKMTLADMLVVKKIKFKGLIEKHRRKNNKNCQKRETLYHWLKAIKGIQYFELQVRRVQIQLHSFFMKKYERLRSSAYSSLVMNMQLSQQKVPKYKETYLRRLRKALLSIVFRNRMQMKIKATFQILKNTELLKQESSHISFLKQKKEKKIYEFKQDLKIKKFYQSQVIFDWILKKQQVNQNSFFVKLMQFKRKVMHKSKKQLKDSPEIMANIVKHMIFLTGQVTAKGKERQLRSREKRKQLKFRGILLKLTLRQRKLKSECLFSWRRAIKSQNNEIEKQIAKLQQIKRYYIEQA